MQYISRSLMVVYLFILSSPLYSTAHPIHDVHDTPSLTDPKISRQNTLEECKETHPKFRSWSIGLNGCSFMDVVQSMGYGITIEYLPTCHHGIKLSSYNMITIVCCGPTWWVGEAGYRWHSGNKGAHGLFIGPSFSFFHCSSKIYYGIAMDVGWQYVFDNGFTISFGPLCSLGIMQLFWKRKPILRVLASIGYSF